jgi:hypothetical protein
VVLLFPFCVVFEQRRNTPKQYKRAFVLTLLAPLHTGRRTEQARNKQKRSACAQLNIAAAAAAAASSSSLKLNLVARDTRADTA